MSQPGHFIGGMKNVNSCGTFPFGSGNFPRKSSPMSFWRLQGGIKSCQHSGTSRGQGQDACSYLALSHPHPVQSVCWEFRNTAPVTLWGYNCIPLPAGVPALSKSWASADSALGIHCLPQAFCLAVAKLSACLWLLNEFTSFHNCAARYHWLLSPPPFSSFLWIWCSGCSITLLCPTLCVTPRAPLPMGLDKNTGVDGHFLLQGIFPDLEMEPAYPPSPALQVNSLPLSHRGSPSYGFLSFKSFFFFKALFFSF